MLSASVFLFGTIAAGVIAYSCLMKAVRLGEVPAATPFRYTNLLFGVMLRVVLFGERLSTPTVLRPVLIVSLVYLIVGVARCYPRSGRRLSLLWYADLSFGERVMI